MGAGADYDCDDSCLCEVSVSYLAAHDYVATNAGGDIVCTSISDFAARAARKEAGRCSETEYETQDMEKHTEAATCNG